MSVGQGKFLRAHQHKLNRVIDQTKARIDGIKARHDRTKTQAEERRRAIRKRLSLDD